MHKCVTAEHVFSEKSDSGSSSSSCDSDSESAEKSISQTTSTTQSRKDGHNGHSSSEEESTHKPSVCSKPKKRVIAESDSEENDCSNKISCDISNDKSSKSNVSDDGSRSSKGSSSLNTKKRQRRNKPKVESDSDSDDDIPLTSGKRTSKQPPPEKVCSSQHLHW